MNKKIKGFKKFLKDHKFVILVAGLTGLGVTKSFSTYEESDFNKKQEIVQLSKEKIPVYIDSKGKELFGYIDGTEVNIASAKKKKINLEGELTQISWINEDSESVSAYINEDYIENAIVFDLNFDTIYQVTGSEKVNVRNSPTLGDEYIINTIMKNQQFLGDSSAIGSMTNNKTWIKGIYIDENGELVSGYIAEEYLEKVLIDSDIGKEKIVKTNGIPLNLRVNADINSELITTIPNGTVIRALDVEEGENNERDWTMVKYDTEDDTIIGYVADEYLRDTIENEGYTVIEENGQNKVVLIDVSNITPTEFRRVLDNGVESPYTDYVGSNKVNGIIFKIGASDIVDNKLVLANKSSSVKIENTEKLIEVAEEYGINYGYYYYSLSRDENEANIEYDIINELIQEAEDLHYENTGKNLKPQFPLFVDNEVDDYPNSLAKAGSTEAERINNITGARALLINKLVSKYGEDKVGFYVNKNSIMPESNNRILDEDLLMEKLNYKNIPTWFTNTYYAVYKGKEVRNKATTIETLETYIKTLEEKGYNVIMQQRQTDCLSQPCDVNSMNEEAYLHYIQENTQEKEKKGIFEKIKGFVFDER